MAFEKVKKAEDRKKLTEALAYIVTQTQGPLGKATAPTAVVESISKYEPTFIKVQGEPDAMGQVSVFATSLGIAAVTGQAPAEATEVVKPTFKLEKGIALPPSKRGGGLKSDTYPFASMEEDDSFFIAATDAKPNPAKSLQSTITTANRRYAKVFPAKKGKNPHPQAGQPTGKDGRKFVVRPRTMELHGEQGARVWRMKLSADSPAA